MENQHSESDALALRNRLLCGLLPLEEQVTINFEDIQEEMKRTFGSQNPQAAMNMLAQFRGRGETVDFVLISEEGQQHDPRFTMQGMLGDETFSRVVAPSKVKCRQVCAYLMWKAILDEEIAKLESICRKATTSTEERLAALSHLKYWQTVQQDPQLIRGKKILAAFILEKKQRGRNNSLFEVVSLATGNRFIENGHLSCDGTVLIDSHAEVLARRALLIYLYKELIKAAQADNGSIFESFIQGRSRLKKGISFHLYVSTAPCGDSSLFTHSGRSKKPLGSEHQGILRYKFERGEACRPTAKCPETNSCLLAAQFADLSITKMCCSDKICKWNVLGVQGALLSNLVDSIYLKSITIGENFDEEHAKRAFSYRLGMDQPNKTPLVDQLQKPFRIATPSVANSSLQMSDSSIPETKHTSDHCMLWSAGAATAQGLSASGGTALDGTEPFACKKALFEQYQHLQESLGKSLGEDCTYRDSKLSASAYQHTKRALYDPCQQLGFGPWLSIYPEIDMFS